MQITKLELRQIIREELQSMLNEGPEQNYPEQNYRTLLGQAFCMGTRCMATMRVVRQDGAIAAASKGAGETKEEAMQTAKANLAKKLQAIDLDINKIPVKE